MKVSIPSILVKRIELTVAAKFSHAPAYRGHHPVPKGVLTMLLVEAAPLPKG